MSRGSAKKRKIKAWTSNANHGQKPAKGQGKGWPRYQEIRKNWMENRFGTRNAEVANLDEH